MKKKHEAFREHLYLYCFVDFGTSLGGQPRCWVIPSAIVAEALVASYQAWLHKPGKGGKVHSDHDMRRLRPGYDDLALDDYGTGWMDQYEDAWGLIAAAKKTEEVPLAT